MRPYDPKWNDGLVTAQPQHGEVAFVVTGYRGHKILFTDEVRQWAEDFLFVSTERRWRAVHGSSSGGHYALSLGREQAGSI